MKPYFYICLLKHRTWVEQLFFDLKGFSLSLHISIHIFNPENSPWEPSNIIHKKLALQEGKKGVRAAFPYLETAKYEKEINGFLVEKQDWKSLVVSRFLCPHQALQNRLESG